ncbi:MAG: 50S ribosomal protein L13 [Candidatus Woesearchaeota archaeon]
MIIIDGKDLVVGRVATFAAKQALNGETIKIVNCEQMYITGAKKFLLNDVHRKRVQGTWEKGPFYLRRPDRFVRRIVRGMIPYRTSRGDLAYRRVMCYIGFPKELEQHKSITIDPANIKHIKNLKYLTVGDLCKHMGAKF